MCNSYTSVTTTYSSIFLWQLVFTWWVFNLTCQNPSSFLKLKIGAITLPIFQLLVCVISETYFLSIGNILFAIHGVFLEKEAWMMFYWQWTPFAVRECCSDTGLSPCLIDHKIEISTLTSKRWDESESDSFSNQLEVRPLLSFTLDWVKIKRFYCSSTEPIIARSDGGRVAVTMHRAAFDIFSNPFWF